MIRRSGVFMRVIVFPGRCLGDRNDQSVLPERLAEHHRADEIAEAALLGRQIIHDAVDHHTVGECWFAAQGVAQKILGECAGELLVPRDQQAAEVGDAGERLARRERAAGIDLVILRIVRPPAADGVEVFQREAVGVDFAVTTRAGRILAMLGELFSDGFRAAGV